MRGIKFKAWDGKQWYDRVLASRYEDGPCSLVWLEDRKKWVHHDGVICQYTGIKDTNGVEVYEDDLVDTEHGIMVVTWDEEDSRFYFSFIDADCDCNCDCCDLVDVYDFNSYWFEVVGNIHDTKYQDDKPRLKPMSPNDSDVLLRLAKIGQQMQWIPVNERLPERPLHDWVLVATKLVPENWYGVPHIAELRSGIWYSHENDAPMEELYGVVVTHWMPLPQPPKEEL